MENARITIIIQWLGCAGYDYMVVHAFPYATNMCVTSLRQPLLAIEQLSVCASVCEGCDREKETEKDCA